MTISREIILHDGPGGPFESMAVRDDGPDTTRPGILLVPNVLGTKEADFEKAESIAAMGYVVLVADIYGQGKRATRQDDDPARYMDALNADRALLRDRLAAALATLGALPGCDAGRLAAVGFCFGGKCVLDMARAGMAVAGVVSLHGVYDRPHYANARPMTARILICHGWDDPFSPPDAAFALMNELTEAGADWQLHAYGRTAHGFTDRSANLPERGVVYAADADRRSFAAMQDFLAELFPG